MNDHTSSDRISKIKDILKRPTAYHDCLLVTRLGYPAVYAFTPELKRAFPDGLSHFERQTVGADVAVMMRAKNHDIVNPKKRVPGGVFSYAAHWTEESVR